MTNLNLLTNLLVTHISKKYNQEIVHSIKNELANKKNADLLSEIVKSFNRTSVTFQ